MTDIYIIFFSLIIFFTFSAIIYYLFCRGVTITNYENNTINPLFIENQEEVEMTESLIQNKITSNFQNYSIYHTNSEEECIICLEPLNQSKIINLGCLHKYHLDCLVSWWEVDNDNSSCPTCRTKII